MDYKLKEEKGTLHQIMAYDRPVQKTENGFYFAPQDDFLLQQIDDKYYRLLAKHISQKEAELVNEPLDDKGLALFREKLTAMGLEKIVASITAQNQN